MSQDTDLTQEAEILERYAVQGDAALQEPDVAQYAAQNPEVVERLQMVLERYRAPLSLDVKVPPVGLGGFEGRGKYFGRGWRRWVGYSGVIAAMVVGLIGIKYNYGTLSTSYPKYTTYSTTIGQRANITLSDGSRVTIAPLTVLRITDRNVELDGEAVFTITQHTGKPFIVRTGNTITRVLGTTFVVRAYDGNVRVAVQEGRVAVGRNISLSAGDVAAVARNGKATIQRNTNIASMFSWTSGQVVFEDLPLPEVLQELERWYGVRFVVQNSSLSRKLVTTRISTQSLDEMSRILATMLNARVQQTGSIVTIQTR